MSLYFQLTYIPAPYTIYKNINKLEANHYLEFDTEKFNFTINKIRKLENLTSSSNISFKNAKKITFDLVMESVKSRSVSDVKVGAFLSGGVDSSIISLCHSLNQKNKIDTFSLGFKNKSYDESNKFRTISNHLNSNHNEIFVDLKDNVFDIDRLLLNYDEPFADSSAIPTFLISKYTSNKVKVVLSGDGGDEVFGGYNKYLMGNINNFYTRLISKSMHKKIKPFLDALLYENNDKRGLKHKLKKVINSIDFDGKYYEKIISLGFSNSELKSIIKEGFFVENILSDLSKKNIKSISDFRELDRIISLEGDMLVKVDRATMLNSLECRAPFLNYKLWDFISGLPENYLIKNLKKKYLLKESFRNYFPKNFLDKPKKGFEIPVGDWLRNNFKVELLTYIEEEFLTKQKIFNVEMIQELVEDHIESRKDNTFKVWTFFCFQKWYKNIYLSF